MDFTYSKTRGAVISTAVGFISSIFDRRRCHPCPRDDLPPRLSDPCRDGDEPFCPGRCPRSSAWSPMPYRGTCNGRKPCSSVPAPSSARSRRPVCQACASQADPADAGRRPALARPAPDHPPLSSLAEQNGSNYTGRYMKGCAHGNSRMYQTRLATLDG